MGTKVYQIVPPERNRRRMVPQNQISGFLGANAYYAGIETVKMEPSLTLLTTVSFPPSKSTNSLTMESPSPVESSPPEGLLVRL